MDIKTTIKLNNGIEMPILGLGVWKSKPGGEVEHAIQAALDLGYRSMDTAAMYLNEEGVGKAIRESQISRSEMFITSKVWNSDQGYKTTLDAFEKSLGRLQLEYLDLYLIHWPVKGRFVETWKALEDIYRQGRVKAIGVSNFLIHHLQELLQEVDLIPAVNQVEFHPHLIQQDLVDYCESKGIRMEAWGPLIQGKIKEVKDVVEIGKKYNKSPAQVVLRWNIQRGVITIPKSSNYDRIKENANIFDFELTTEEMNRINSLDRNYRYGPDPDHIDF